MIKLIASGLDGTLLNANGKFNEIFNDSGLNPVIIFKIKNALMENESI